MPVYTYECDECGVRFDVRQKFSDSPVTECPECTGHTHRVPQAVGVVFKGSGWYVTDSRGRNNLATPPKKDSSDDTKSAKADTSTTSSNTSSADKKN